MRPISRRGALLADFLTVAAPGSRSTPLRDGASRLLGLPDATRIAQVHPGGPSGLLGVAVDGGLLALSPHAGLLVLSLAVLGVAAAGHKLVRFEPAVGGRWQAVSRSQEALLPDARPLQADLDGRGDGGRIVVLEGLDAQRCWVAPWRPRACCGWSAMDWRSCVRWTCRRRMCSRTSRRGPWR
jgi:hypothetical protein